MNLKKLCSDFVNSDNKIRFVGVLNSKGILVEQKNRENSNSLLTDDELKMLVYYTFDRWNRLLNLQHKLGKVKETITKFENANTIILFLDDNLFLVSTDPNSNNSKITSNLWKIIEKRPVKKGTSKKRPVKKGTSKKRPVKKGTSKKRPVKKGTSKKRPVKKKR